MSDVMQSGTFGSIEIPNRFALAPMMKTSRRSSSGPFDYIVIGAGTAGCLRAIPARGVQARAARICNPFHLQRTDPQ